MLFVVVRVRIVVDARDPFRMQELNAVVHKWLEELSLQPQPPEAKYPSVVGWWFTLGRASESSLLYNICSQ